MQEPIVNLSQSQSQSPIVPPLTPPSTTTPIPPTISNPSTTTPIQTIAQPPPVSSVTTSTPLPPPIFTDSTTTTTQPPLIQNEEHVSEENDDFNVPDDDEFEQIRSFQTFVEPILAASFLDDESDRDDEIVFAPATIKYYQMFNRKLNALVRRSDSFFPTNFQILMITHENTLKTIIGESKRLFDAQAKFIDEATLKVQTALPTSNNAL
ncbi:unnamed protein product [Lactuca virosa]|uniref:Uncharacterized protein n=1 Tax=Lactuca virosa TaxID=75947 RepID=A0AAU9LVS4_9ASTR|nr:unnamed protein product [Lactuca virosa]